MQVQARCPELHTFYVEHPRNINEGGFLLRFLQAMPSITNLTVRPWIADNFGREEDISDELWFHIAARPSLRVLSTYLQAMEWSLVSKIKERVPQPFESVQDLECKINTEALYSLLPHLSRLTHLEVRLISSSTNALSNIARNCLHLQNIIIAYPEDSSCGDDEIRILADTCKDLRVIEIAGYWRLGYVEKADEVTDAGVAYLAKTLPRLEECRLWVKSDLSADPLRILGQNCRALRSLALRGPIHVEDLRHEGDPLFSRLKSLSIQQVKHRGGMEEPVDVLAYHAPMIKSFRSGDKTHNFDGRLKC